MSDEHEQATARNIIGSHRHEKLPRFLQACLAAKDVFAAVRDVQELVLVLVLVVRRGHGVAADTTKGWVGRSDDTQINK